jgi:hypothetical protein
MQSVVWVSRSVAKFLVPAIAVAVFVGTSGSAAASEPSWRYLAASIEQGRHFSETDHNVFDLRLSLSSGRSVDASFLGFFNRTGGLERWGLPTSEAFEEFPGVLRQYFKKGVLEFRPGTGVQRALVWEFFGGGLAGSTDMGVEPGTQNDYRGVYVGPWQHKVSNFATDGTRTGFLEIFQRLGGVESFGFPKTEARRDQSGSVRLDDTPGRVRQYFQAGVFEYDPASGRFSIRALGTMLRDRLYPDNGWMEFLAFRRTSAQYPIGSVDSRLLGHASVPALVTPLDGALVGRGEHSYAIAYHPQRHVFYADGWYVLYYDGGTGASGASGLVAYSKDGTSFGNRTKVTHVHTGPGMSMHYIDGTVYVLYSDSDKRRVFLRAGRPINGSIDFGEPILVADMVKSFGAYLATLAAGPDGLPWILIRSFDARPGTGALVSHIWLTHPKTVSLDQWTSPLRITTEVEAVDTGAGASGSLAFVGGRIVILYCAGERCHGITGSAFALDVLKHVVLDEYAGTHDYGIQANGEQVVVVYAGRGVGRQSRVQVMKYRTWSSAGGWTEPTVVDRTNTHSTALSIDASGNVWSFYAQGSSVLYRVRRAGGDIFDPARCAVAPIPLERAASHWLAAGPGSLGDLTGLLWVERPTERFEVKFKVLDLADPQSDGDCSVRSVPVSAPVTMPQVHHVRSGDTLSGIAGSHNMSLARLIEVNEITNPNHINVGQTLRLPESS